MLKTFEKKTNLHQQGRIKILILPLFIFGLEFEEDLADNQLLK